MPLITVMIGKAKFVEWKDSPLFLMKEWGGLKGVFLVHMFIAYESESGGQFLLYVTPGTHVNLVWSIGVYVTGICNCKTTVYPNFLYKVRV